MKPWQKIVDWFELRQIKLDRKRRQDALDRRLKMALFGGQIEEIEQAILAGARPSVLLQHYMSVHYGKFGRRCNPVLREWLYRKQRVELPRKCCTHNAGHPTSLPRERE